MIVQCTHSVELNKLSWYISEKFKIPTDCVLSVKSLIYLQKQYNFLLFKFNTFYHDRKCRFFYLFRWSTVFDWPIPNFYVVSHPVHSYGRVRAKPGPLYLQRSPSWSDQSGQKINNFFFFLWLNFSLKIGTQVNFASTLHWRYQIDEGQFVTLTVYKPKIWREFASIYNWGQLLFQVGPFKNILLN